MGLEQVPPDLLVKRLGNLSWNSKDSGNGEDDARALKLAGDEANKATNYYNFQRCYK